MTDHPVVVLPPLIGGQAESWASLVELAPAFGDNWLLVGGQMVFLHEVERQANDVGVALSSTSRSRMSGTT